jgi:hypothetical protein
LVSGDRVTSAGRQRREHAAVGAHLVDAAVGIGDPDRSAIPRDPRARLTLRHLKRIEDARSAQLLAIDRCAIDPERDVIELRGLSAALNEEPIPLARTAERNARAQGRGGISTHVDVGFARAEVTRS